MDAVNPALLADLISALHLAIVLYVILGQLAVLVGWPLRWRWIRSPLFRWSHAGTMVFVAVQGALGKICPLTTWERELREAAGQAGREGTFVGRLAHDILFVDVPQSTLDRIYIVFAAVVVASLVLCRPRRDWKNSGSASAPAPRGHVPSTGPEGEGPPPR